MIMNIICALCIYPIIPFIYYCFKKNAVREKYVFGTTLNSQAREDEEIKQLIEIYKKKLKKIFWILMIVPVVVIFIPYSSVTFTFWMFYLFAGMFVLALPYIRTNRLVMIYKYEKLGLGNLEENEENKKEIQVDLKSIATPEIKTGSMLIPTTISVVAAVVAMFSDNYHTAVSFVVVLFAVTTVIFHIVTKFMMVQKNEIICADSDININYSRALKKTNQNYMFWLAMVNTFVTVAICISLLYDRNVGSVILWSGIFEAIVACIFTIRLMKIRQKIDKAYMPYVEEELLGDDDIYWKYGLIYNNPKDKHSMVNARLGVGTTVNMAKPSGKILAAIAIGSIALCLFLGIFMMVEEFTPIHLKIKDDTISCIHTKEKYTIDIDDIREITVLGELPDMTKDIGTAMDNCYKGQFTESDTHDICKVFLNPQNDIFIRIKTDDNIYIISGYDDEETKQIYNQILYNMETK